MKTESCNTWSIVVCTFRAIWKVSGKAYKFLKLFKKNNKIRADCVTITVKILAKFSGCVSRLPILSVGHKLQ